MKLGPIGACPFWAGLFHFHQKLQKSLSGAAFLHSRSVEKSTGRQDHTVLPYAASTTKDFNQPSAAGQNSGEGV
jgi:hypothetical protein